MKIKTLIRLCLYIAILLLASACSKVTTATETKPQSDHLTLSPSPAPTVIPKSTVTKTPEQMKIPESSATSTTFAAEQPRKFYENLPAGEYIVYSSVDTTTENPSVESLKIVSLDGQFGNTITELKYGANYLAKVSPDLKWVAYQQYRPDEGIFIMELLTGAITKVRELEGCLSFDWSPDSTKLVFAAGDIFVYSLEEKTIDALSNNLIHENKEYHSIAWSPDGKWIIAHTRWDHFGDRDVEGKIYLIDTNCLMDIPTCPEKTTFFDKAKNAFYAPTWSPTSRSVAAFLEPGVIGIWDVEEKVFREVTIPDWQTSYILFEWGYLAWSLDGKWLAYSQADNHVEGDQNTDYDLFVVPVGGGKSKVVLDNDDIKLVMGWIRIP